MGREEILGAIERTAREIDICGYQAPKAVCPTTLADMNQYREFQE